MLTPSSFHTRTHISTFFLRSIFVLCSIGLLCLLGASAVIAEVSYAALAGGLDRGDGASLPALGFKLGWGGAKSSVEVTYARGGIRREGSYQVSERVLGVGHVTRYTGSWWTGHSMVGVGVVNANSEASGNYESASAAAMTFGAGVVLLGFLQLGVDSFVGLVPGTIPLYALGIRNFWHVGLAVSF